MDELWGITAYFNPAKYRRRLENHRYFRQRLGIPLLAVELSFDGQFELAATDADRIVQISGGAILWQKERLLNVALAALPRGCTKVAWLDCDIIFGRSDWAEATSSLLDRHPLLQPFSHAQFMPPDWQPGEQADSLEVKHPPAFLIAEGAPVEAAIAFARDGARQMAYTPGIAWAARRELLTRHLFYDACIMGGGDGALMRAAYGFPWLTRDLQRMGPERYAHYLAWAEPFRESLDGETVGFVPGNVYHMWHGASTRRRYTRRHEGFAQFEFNPTVDIALAANGAWRWASSKPDMHAFARDYFIERNEDD